MRRSFTLFSICAHTIAIAAFLYAQILADSTLPTPHRPLMFDSGSFMPVEVQLPRPPVARPARASSTVSENAAPVMAPEGVNRETGREGAAPATAGAVAGVESGPPSASIEGVGVAAAAPPPPPERPAAPVRLPSGIRPPVKTVDVAPAYPTIARTAHVQGIVILEAVLDASGRVDDVHVLRSIPLLDQAAIDAVRQWRYTPTLFNGRAIPIVLTVTVSFKLE
jgi:periplasmic protein TonB